MPANRPTALSRAEADFWQRAFVAASQPLLMKHDGEAAAVPGIAHLAADFADAAVLELRRAKGAK